MLHCLATANTDMSVGKQEDMRRKPVSDHRWQGIDEHAKQLYVNERKTLAEVVMKLNEMNFFASYVNATHVPISG